MRARTAARLLRFRFLALAAVLSLGACAPPATARSGEEGERRRALATIRRIEETWPVAGSGPALSIVREVGERLARAAGTTPDRWRFTVLRDRSINAFAVGDGRIFVNEGVVSGARNEAELAAILAHEMGHQIAGHFREPPPADSGDTRIGSVVHAFDLEREREADRFSIDLLRRAGYDAHGALSVALQAGRRRWGPNDEERIETLRGLLEGIPRDGRRDSEDFRAARAALTP